MGNRRGAVTQHNTILVTNLVKRHRHRVTISQRDREYVVCVRVCITENAEPSRHRKSVITERRRRRRRIRY